MLTVFGETFRQIRKKRGLLLKDVAEKLQIMPSFVSSIEHGTKAIPDGYVAKVCDTFELDAAERRQLCTAEAQVRKKLTINRFDRLPPVSQEVATALAQEIERLPEQRLRKILALLRAQDDEPGDPVLPSDAFDD